ncbi:thioester reductase domain-containing protein [Pseudoduganella sp. LjRoot289]|uniref:thioester reductase domain-containing protein n=1 Tax=Pseudoduganella sp. LjRoot289 TaxID=3342314 RepID=UPI003ECDB191
MKQLLLELNERGVKLRLNGNELRVHAPSRTLTPALRSALIENKDSIISELRAGSAVNQTPPRPVADAAAEGRGERVAPRDALEQTALDAWSRGMDCVAIAAVAAEPPPAMLADAAAGIADAGQIDFGMPPAPAVARALLVTGGTGWIGAHLLAELLAATDATLCCLVRAANKEEGLQRLIEGMRRHGVMPDRAAMARIVVVCGDLAAPGLGLDEGEWNRMERSVDAIYHFGASVDVLADYASHRKVNVAPLAALMRLAAEHRLKPVFLASPMAVCRRQIGGRLVALSGERAHADPNGLPSPYAQSKWVAEQVLLAAAQRGLPVRIYRSSHALPSARSGRAKPCDSYGSVLRVACEAGVVPDWNGASVHGVPVDTLARLLVEHSLAPYKQQQVIHLENRNPLALPAVMAMLLAAPEDADCLQRVPFDEWKARCIEAAERLEGSEAALARQLFLQRADGCAIDNMFTHHLFDTHHFERRGHAAKLSDLTPRGYWRAVAGNMHDLG